MALRRTRATERPSPISHSVRVNIVTSYMKNILFACTFLVVCCSCESLILHADGGAGQYDGKAIIRDYMTGYNYEVLTIDGLMVNRVQHGRIVSRVPNIIIGPGSHTFGIRGRIIDLGQKDETSEPLQYVTAHVDPGREYFFRKLSGRYIIEEIEYRK